MVMVVAVVVRAAAVVVVVVVGVRVGSRVELSLACGLRR